MDWNRGVLLLAQTCVVCVLGALVALGHDSVITDALLAVCGSLAGVGVYETIKSKSKTL
jgi:glycopeptide antibiotics resistance protein